MSRSYLSSKCEVRKSSIHGVGIFAKRLIEKGEIYAIKGGSIVSGEFLDSCDKRLLPSFLQIEDDKFIGALDLEELPLSLIGFNHSCDPNAGFHGNIIGVAMRDILVGEEITNDYAMFLSHSYLEMECRCGSRKCRNKITKDDWKDKEIQERYRGYFALYLEEKISKTPK
jgi:SET domain-containing protein